VTFAWTDQRLEKARALYVDQLRPPTTVARCVGGGCTGELVLAAAKAGGWDEGRALKRPNFAPELIERARKLYVDQLQAPEAVAKALGARFTARQVRRMASSRGWPAERPAWVAAAHKRAVLEAARDKAAAGRAASTNMKPPPGRTVVLSTAGQRADRDAQLREQIEAAIAAGKLQVLPPAHAAGLSAMETQFWGAGAGGSWRGRRFGFGA
jgi:hypothetical protein